MSKSEAFLCHPHLFREHAGGWRAAALPPPASVRHVQDVLVPGQRFPNRATHWVAEHLGPILGTRLGVLDDGAVLRVIDMLVQCREGGAVAVFILFGDGSATTYRRAVRYVAATRAAASKNYGLAAAFLLLHVTRRGVLRRKWV